MGTGKRGVVAIFIGLLLAMPLVASAAGLKIGINPKELSFGKVMVDTVSAAKTVKVSNPNSSAISITSIAPSGPFAVSANTCGPMLAAKPNRYRDYIADSHCDSDGHADLDPGGHDQRSGDGRDACGRRIKRPTGYRGRVQLPRCRGCSELHHGRRQRKLDAGSSTVRLRCAGLCRRKRRQRGRRL